MTMLVSTMLPLQTKSVNTGSDSNFVCYTKPHAIFTVYLLVSSNVNPNQIYKCSMSSQWIKWKNSILAQGHQGFTPEYVIKNQTKPHLRNYSFLHSHFLTSSQTKLLIPWTFFNVQYIIHRGFGSLHATALASKMRQQSDWTGKNYLFNIDCRWLGPVSVYLQTRISCFTRLPIISSLSTGCS